MAGKIVFIAGLSLAAFGLLAVGSARAQTQDAVRPDEKVISDQINHLRSLPDDVRTRTTKQLAIDIRQLPSTNKVNLAYALANYSTEGDFGHDTLQEVATTLAGALREKPPPMIGNQPAQPYVELAMLVRYEHVQASLDDPQFAAALAKIDADNETRRSANFTLTDLQGKSWTLQELHGKVVLVNFWATWCQPCRREMPDLDALYQRFKDPGLVVLAISDEEAGTLNELLAEKKVSYPILLDPGGKVYKSFQLDGIPKSFIYDRDGRLVSQAIDMRTQKQFLELLAKAGLH
jgi:peroxiredoxin